ncbi:hypothetical protein NC653_028599 [Populus alba x Populus x berolinensis]|uniref:RNase H type-1 domain-containing protein n=1 Tax=Populus alba x Populus x berolinensis TaxID=444605 RepID=A0AAD6Q4A7_9ROSI|nr:hypothetical protein NC653_028599 [Populus alba x Populus x berolinensis]
MPAIEELKWNVDCPAFGKPGRAKIGGVLRDHKVLKALELAASREELCGKRFIIESDSANVVNWMRDKPKRPWKFHDIFMRAARFMAVLKLVHYAHVLREGNHMADSLEKQGVNRGSDLVA